MKATDFLRGESPYREPRFSEAKEFLGIRQPFAGGKPGRISGAGGEFPEEKKWWHEPVEWITGGHVSYEPMPPQEVIQGGRPGGPALINVPESARMSIFEEPTGVPLMASVAGVARPAATIGRRVVRGIREGVGWLTGGATEVPALTKAGIKAVPGAVRGLEAKGLEKTMARAAEKPLGQVPTRMGLKEVPRALPAAPAKAIESELAEKQFAERFLEEGPGVDATFKEMIENVKAGVPGGFIRVSEGQGYKTTRWKSGYPDWYRDLSKKFGIDKGKFLTAIEKGMAGEKLGKKQEQIWFETKAIARERTGAAATSEYAWGQGMMERELAAEPKFVDAKKIQMKGDKLYTPEGVELFSGIPIHKAGEAWTKKIGEPLWDKVIMTKVPKLLEKVPGGKAVNRALIYEYRGDLPNTAKYLHSMEDMKRGQAIGREYAVDLGKRLQGLPEDAQLRMGEYIRGELDTLKAVHEKNLADEAKAVILDLGRQAVDVGLLSEAVFFKNAGRYMPRLYTSKEYHTLLTKFKLTKPNLLDLSRFKKRKDIPKAIREEMGEILTPGFPVAKGITQITHDIELARYFRGIATNKEWAVVKKSQRAIPEGWQQLPQNRKLGVLSEAHVHPEIYADLQESVRVMETPERVWRKALGSWKFGKVILSPKTHVRNMMSNSVLAHLGGLPMYEQPVYLTKAAVELRRKGKYWEEVKELGGLEHTFTKGELGILFDQVEGQMAGIKAGGLAEKFGIIGNGWGQAKKALRKAADLYQAEEQWFKMAKYIHNIERKGMAKGAAWADAEKWLFNYQKVTKFQEKYRSRWYGAPFATFTFKALPRIAEAAIKTPWRFAVPGAIIYGLEKAAQRKIGDTTEEIRAKKALRPDWQQGKMLGTPNFARVPFVDEYGREYWLNLTYILPWGDIGEAGKFGPIPGGLVPFSQPFIKEPVQQILNYDKFWEEQIVKDVELAGKTRLGKIKTQAKLRGRHIAQAMLPTPVFDVAKVVDAIRQKPDYRGRFRKPKVVFADVIAGIKLYPVDYMEELSRKIGKIDPNTGYLARKIHTQIRTLAIKKQALEKRGVDTTTYDEQIADKIEQLRGLAKETKEIGKLKIKRR